MFKRRMHWPGYVAGLALVALVTAFGLLTHGIIAPPNMIMLFLLIVVIAAVRWGQGPALLTAVAGVLAFDFFLVAPQLTLAVADTQYTLTFLGLLVTGLVISTLATRARREAEGARRREAETAALYQLARDLTATTRPEEIATAVARNVARTFGGHAAVFSREGDMLRLQAATEGFADEVRQGPADWVFKHGRATGLGEGGFAEETSRYVPVRSGGDILGVLAVCPRDGAPSLGAEEVRLMEALANQAALAFERARLAEEASRARVLEATERLQSALLNSLSHDLRTPLATITGGISALRDADVELDESTRAALIEDIAAEAERLDRFVGNLLDMSRLEAGALKVVQEPGDIAEVIGAALVRYTGPLSGRPLELDVPGDLPPAPMGAALITQVVANLLENALKYSADGTPVRVAAWAEEETVVVEVADRGPGIPPEDLGRIFDKFYRVQRTGSAGGAGLGLAISKGIIEAHGGRIEAGNREGGGTVMRFALPLHTRETA